MLLDLRTDFLGNQEIKEDQDIRNGMDLKEAEDIKKKWQEYKKELQKKDHHEPDNHNGVITNLEPDILECEVKWSGIPISVRIVHTLLWSTQSKVLA